MHDPLATHQARLSSRRRGSWLHPRGSLNTMDAALRLYQVHSRTLLVGLLVPSLFTWAGLFIFFWAVLPGVAVSFTVSRRGALWDSVMWSIVATLVVVVPLLSLGSTLGQLFASKLVAESESLKLQLDRAGIWRPLALTTASLSVLVFVQCCFGALLVWLAENLVLSPDQNLQGLSVLGTLAASPVWFLFTWLTFRRWFLLGPVRIFEGKGWNRASALLSGWGSQTLTGVIWCLVILSLFIGSSLILLADFIVNGFVGSESVRSSVIDPAGHSLLIVVSGAVPSFIAVWLLTPIWQLSRTLVYLDRLVRLEALDVTSMLQEVNRARTRVVMLD